MAQQGQQGQGRGGQSRGGGNQQQQQGGALAVYTPTSGPLAPVHTQEVIAQLETLLEGCPLTPERLFLDLAAYFGANPTVAVYAKPAGVYNCLLTAGRLQTTFGEDALWIIPEGGDVRPQESKRFIVARAMEDAGIERIDARLVHEPDKPVTVERDDYGAIVRFSTNPDADITAERTEANLLGGFGVVYWRDVGREPLIEWFAKADLQRRKEHSAAWKNNKSPSWRDDPLPMHEGAIKAAMGRLVNPIRSRKPGAGGSFRPRGQDIPWADYTVAEDPDAPPGDLMGSLDAQAAAYSGGEGEGPSANEDSAANEGQGQPEQTEGAVEPLSPEEAVQVCLEMAMTTDAEEDADARLKKLWDQHRPRIEALGKDTEDYKAVAAHFVLCRKAASGDGEALKQLDKWVRETKEAAQPGLGVTE